jgi:hypothetical protein
VRKIVIPAMVPRLFVALRLGVAIALVVAVTVEIAANPHGMGYAIMIAQQSLDPALMLAWLFWIGVVGYAINAGALALQQAVARRMGRWHEPRALRRPLNQACGRPMRRGGLPLRLGVSSAPPTPKPRWPAWRAGSQAASWPVSPGRPSAHAGRLAARFLAGIALGALVGISARAALAAATLSSCGPARLRDHAARDLHFHLGGGMVPFVVAFGDVAALLATLHGFASVEPRLRE